MDSTKEAVGIERGIIKRTAFGERFMRAVGLDVTPMKSSLRISA